MCTIHITVLVPPVSLLRESQAVIPLYISKENTGFVQLIKCLQAQAFLTKGVLSFFMKESCRDGLYRESAGILQNM